MTVKTDNEAVREALACFRSMVLCGEKLSPQAQEVWDRAYAVVSPNPETIEEQAAHGVALADVLEPLVRQWLNEHTSPGAIGSPPDYRAIDSDEIPDFVAFLAGELVAKGFGKR